MSPTSYQAAPSRGKGMILLHLSGIDGCFSGVVGAFDQFHQGHGRVVTHAETHFQNAGVAARARFEARAQHIERWTVPRTSYPEGRIAYLTWRKDLQKLHARRAGEIMAQCGYSDDDIARTGSLLRKERLKQDADAQTLEDVICLVFLGFEAEPFIAKHDDDKVRDILAKTAKKMSPRGLAAAAQVPMGERLERLLVQALA